MSLYNDEVILTPVILDDEWADNTDDTPVTYDCRYQNKNKLMYNSSGKEITVSNAIIIEGEVTVKEGDKIKLTKFKGSTIAVPKDVEVKAFIKTGTFSIHHTEIYI